MTLSIIGAGAVATCLSPWLQESGHEIIAVTSRSIHSAEILANCLGCNAVDGIGNLPKSDAVLICVSDDKLGAVASQAARLFPESLLIHTSGGQGLEVFNGKENNCAVMYPLQTFTKGVELNVSQIPFFVDASDEPAMESVKELAGSISRTVVELDSDGRAKLHVAAVFASNFSNHCYSLASELMERNKFDWKWLLPLIDETARKIHNVTPMSAQTGPASRHDYSVMESELKMLEKDASLAEIYKMMSRSIIKLQQN